MKYEYRIGHYCGRLCLVAIDGERLIILPADRYTPTEVRLRFEDLVDVGAWTGQVEFLP